MKRDLVDRGRGTRTRDGNFMREWLGLLCLALANGRAGLARPINLFAETTTTVGVNKNLPKEHGDQQQWA